MSLRLEKVKSQLRRILGNIFMSKSKDFGIDFVSINDILVSRDLSTAKIWVSFTKQTDQQRSFNNLINNSKTIQSLLYKNFVIKKVPKIKWQLDTDSNLECRIEKILDDIKKPEDQN